MKLVRRILRSIHRLLSIDDRTLSLHRRYVSYKYCIYRSYATHRRTSGIIECFEFTVSAQEWYRLVLGVDDYCEHLHGRLGEIEPCKVERVMHCKEVRAGGKEHEFVLVEMRHEESGDRRYVCIDRRGCGDSVDDPEAYFRFTRFDESRLGDSITARDTVSIFGVFPVRRCGVDAADILRVLTFNEGKAPSVFQLSTLLNTLSLHFDQPHRTCYWHANMIYEVFKIHFPLATEEIGDEFHRKGCYAGRRLFDDFRAGGLNTYFVSDSEDIERQVKVVPEHITPQELVVGYLMPALEQAQFEVRERMIAIENEFQRSRRLLKEGMARIEQSNKERKKADRGRKKAEKALLEQIKRAHPEVTPEAEREREQAERIERNEAERELARDKKCEQAERDIEEAINKLEEAESKLGLFQHQPKQQTTTSRISMVLHGIGGVTLF